MTLAIAVIGCATGCLALLLQFFSFRRDRYVLDFGFNVSYTRAKPDESMRPVLHLWLTNTGRSPIEIQEINWLVRHCDLKMEIGLQQKDADVRFKLFDRERDGQIKLEHNDRKDLRFPFQSPFLVCSDDSAIELVDVLGKRIEKPTGTLPKQAMQTPAGPAPKAASRAPEDQC